MSSVKEQVRQEHWKNEAGRPVGGTTYGTGFAISWQNGPLVAEGDDVRREPNGAFVEDVITAAIGRLEFFQSTEFACGENSSALGHLYAARHFLESRANRRTREGKEGTHKV